MPTDAACDPPHRMITAIPRSPSAARVSSASHRAKSVMLVGRTRLTYKFPIHPECGGNNFHAIAAFAVIEVDAEADE
jgi:hypothetical protein